jgi:hypothetical protein
MLSLVFLLVEDFVMTRILLLILLLLLVFALRKYTGPVEFPNKRL